MSDIITTAATVSETIITTIVQGETVVSTTVTQAARGAKGDSGEAASTWEDIQDKPTTFAPIIGPGAADACAGNDARLSDARTPTAHTHAYSAITDKPTTFTPTAHKSTHATGGSDALDASDIGALAASSSLSDLASIPTARANLGLENNEITETTTSRTLALTDSAKFIRCTNSGAIAIIIPQQGTGAGQVPWQPGATSFIHRAIGAGAITIGGSGVTINQNTSASIAAGGTMAIRKSNATDVWDFI